jgi:hypothetical protein
MANCPSCRRPVAVARATCFYCGAALPPEDGATAAAPPPPAPPPEERGERTLVVLDLAGVDVAALAEALGRPEYEAGLLARRGGFHLHRVLEPAAAAAEADRLSARGVATLLLPEAEARVRPLRALGGERGDGVLALRTEEGPVEVRRGDVLLVVRGSIVREYQPSARRRRVDTARLEEGYRVHLHRRREPRPVEIDAAVFERGLSATGSARLEIDAWAEEVRGGAPCDDGFRRLPPALGPAEEEPKGAIAAASSLGPAARGEGSGREEEPLVLDNAAQFRFYSGWRAVLQRRLTRPAEPSS